MPELKKISNINEEFDAKLFAYIARKNVIWVFVFLIISTSSAFIYLRYTPPVYQSGSIVKIGVENRAQEIIAVNTRQEMNSTALIAGQMELMRSIIIFQKAIESLPFRISYYAQGTVLENELFMTSPFEVQASLTDSAALGHRFYIEFFEKNNTYQITYSINGKQVVAVHPLNEWITFEFGNLKVTVTNMKYIQEYQNTIKGTAYFFVVNNVPDLAASMLRNLDVTLLNQDAQTIFIKYKDSNARKTAMVANAVANVFINYDLNKKSEGSDNILHFINEQIEKVNEELRSSENLLEHFKQGNKYIKPDLVANNVISKLNELESRKATTILEFKMIEKLQDALEKEKDVSNLVVFLSGSPSESVLSQLISEYNKLLGEKELILREATTESKQIKNIEELIDNQKKLIAQGIAEAKRMILENKSDIDDSIREFESSFSALPSKEAEFTRLERIYNINQKFFSLLIEKRAEFQIKKAGYVTNNLLLQEAQIPSARISPNRTLISSSSIILGILVGVIIIILRYLFHNKISSLEEIEKYTSAARLGIVPQYKNKVPVSMMLVDKNPKSMISEAFRLIRSNLQFIASETGPKLIAVTSTISGEGKTFMAINLGGVIAFSGKKVIILDLDMRKPKIHLGFGIENTKGMSTILIGKNSIEECVNKSSLESLHFITAGPVPPNPSELIISPNLNKLLEDLKQIYDIIIIDTPPVGIVTDGIPIIQMADYPIYILRANYSKRIFIRNINKLIFDNNIRKLSVVLNNVQFSNSKYGYGYGYGYNYGYGYGYGYGYYEDDKKVTGKSLIGRIFKKEDSQN